MRVSTKFHLPLTFIVIVYELVVATEEDCFGIHLSLLTYSVTKPYFEFFSVFGIDERLRRLNARKTEVVLPFKSRLFLTTGCDIFLQYSLDRVKNRWEHSRKTDYVNIIINLQSYNLNYDWSIILSFLVVPVF